MKECVLDKMPDFINLRVVDALLYPVLFRRDNWCHASSPGGSDYFIGIISAIGKQIVSLKSLDQLASLRTISHGTCRDNNSDRHTMRIHGQMYFCVSPPFVRPIS